MAINTMEMSLVLPVSGKSNKVPWKVRMNCKMRIYKRNKEISLSNFKLMVRVNIVNTTALFSDSLLAEVSMQNSFEKK
jgi:hypothetical protein